MNRRLAILVAATLSVAVGLGASSSIAGADTGGNNVAVVQTNASNQIATRAAVKISHDPGDVNNQNVAIGLFNQLVQTVNQNLQTAGIPANGTIRENAQSA